MTISGGPNFIPEMKDNLDSSKVGKAQAKKNAIFYKNVMKDLTQEERRIVLKLLKGNLEGIDLVKANSAAGKIRKYAQANDQSDYQSQRVPARVKSCRKKIERALSNFFKSRKSSDTMVDALRKSNPYKVPE